MKKVLAFDIDQTLNIAKTPIPEEIAILLTECLNYFEICPISGQKFDQFLIQIVDRLIEVAEAITAFTFICGTRDAILQIHTDDKRK